jgi:hypothetical protein
VATGTLAPLGAASYPVFVYRPAVSLPASSPRLVALSQLQFASFGMVSFRGDFHPQDDVHAGRTRSEAGAEGDRLLQRPVRQLTRRQYGQYTLSEEKKWTFCLLQTCQEQTASQSSARVWQSPS